MKEYRWELHLHTLESSRCARSRAADMVEAYHALGFEGIVVTDHFVNGNSRAPAVAPWKTRIDGFLAGYRALADRRGTVPPAARAKPAACACCWAGSIILRAGIS